MTMAEISKKPLFERSKERLIIQNMFEAAYDAKQYEHIITYEQCARAANISLQQAKAFMSTVVQSLEGEKWFVNIRKVGYRPASPEDRATTIQIEGTKRIRRKARKNVRAATYQDEEWDSLDDTTKITAQGYSLVNHLVAKATSTSNVRAATKLIQNMDDRREIESMSLRKTMDFFRNKG